MMVLPLMVVLTVGLHAQENEIKPLPKHKKAKPAVPALSQREPVSFEIAVEAVPLAQENGDKKQRIKSEETRITSYIATVWQNVMNEAFADAFLKIITGVFIMLLRPSKIWFRARLSRNGMKF